MKKMCAVLLFCALAGSLAFAKPKAKDYPLQFTVLSGVDTADGCYMNVTDGDGSVYELFSDHSLVGHDCEVWSPGVKVKGRFKHYWGASTFVIFFYYVPQKNKPNKPVTTYFKILAVVQG